MFFDSRIVCRLSAARVHRCPVINLNEVEKFVKSEGDYVMMSDGSSMDVSRTRKEKLIKDCCPAEMNKDSDYLGDDMRLQRSGYYDALCRDENALKFFVFLFYGSKRTSHSIR